MKPYDMDAVQAARASPLLWFTTFANISDRTNKVRPLCSAGDDGAPPGPNILQIKFFEILEWCLRNGEPCRMVGVKPRKTGLSTAVQAALYWFHRVKPTISSTCADTYDTTDTLINIFRLYCELDACPWPDGDAFYKEGKWQFPHGGFADRETARDRAAGRAKTPTKIHFSESAHFIQEGAMSADKIILGMTGSLPLAPWTFLITESTPNGITNLHAQTFLGNPQSDVDWLKEGAVEFEDFKKGKRGNNHIKLYAHWWEFSHHRTPNHLLTQERVDEIQRTLDAREIKLLETHGTDKISANQLDWRRNKIAESNGFNNFNQEFIEDIRTAFLTSGRPRFDQEQLDRIEVRDAKVSPTEGFFTADDLEDPDARPVFQVAPDGPIHIWEHPVEGCRYILSIDPADGEEITEGIADAIGTSLIRAAYKRPDGAICREKLVARVLPNFRWETDAGVELLVQLARYYGNCKTVIESNKGTAFIYGMKRWGVPLYRRKEFDNAKGNAKTKKLGFNTNKATKPMIIAHLESLIQGDGDEPEIEIPDQQTLSELRTFIRTAKGTQEASPGADDHSVISLAMGSFCIDQATEFLPRRSRARRRRDNYGNAILARAR